MIGKELGESQNDYGDSARIVYGLFLYPKIKHCIVVKKIGVLSQNTTFRGCDQKLARVGFKDFLDLETGQAVRNMSKLNWMRESYVVRIPHRIIGCENCRVEKMLIL